MGERGDTEERRAGEGRGGGREGRRRARTGEQGWRGKRCEET